MIDSALDSGRPADFCLHGECHTMSASPPVVPTITLSGGGKCPVIGYGLYQIPADESEAATLQAISLGYRHLDSASFYANEPGVGLAIAACGVPREDLFVASKMWTDCIGAGAAAVKASILKSIESLQCGYLDLAYVHWPVSGKHVQAYEALEELHAEGKVKAIGLSNYRVEDYEELMAAPLPGGHAALNISARVQPVVNQVLICL